MILACSFIVVALFSHEAIERLTREDGIVESLQVVFYFTSASIFLYLFRAKLPAKDYPRIGKFLYLGFFVLFLLVAFEEINWGQRVIGFETPYIIKEANYQEEANIHNTGSFQEGVFFIVYSIAVGTFVFAVGILLPLLRMYSTRIKEFIERNKIPLPQPELIFGFVIGSIFFYIEVHPMGHVLALLLLVGVTAPLIVLVKHKTFQLMREAKLVLLQALAVMLTGFGVIFIMNTRHGYHQPMTEIREFFVGLSFLLFGIFSLMEEKGRFLARSVEGEVVHDSRQILNDK
ncbi:MAG: hypothetical protein KAU14_07865 [Thermoplasmata archaeon]|nr:hypothetical protein [Thermoplasmata archaeon]